MSLYVQRDSVGSWHGEARHFPTDVTSLQMARSFRNVQMSRDLTVLVLSGNFFYSQSTERLFVPQILRDYILVFHFW